MTNDQFHRHPLHTLLLQLYDGNVRDAKLDELIRENYDPRCVFMDPLVTTTTIEDFRCQFVALRQLFTSSRIVTDTHQHTHYTNSHNSPSFFVCGDQAFLDATVEYTFYVWTIRLHQVTRLTLTTNPNPNPNQKQTQTQTPKIIRHEDVWSLASLISGLPVIGWVYDVFYRKLLLGILLSLFLRMVQPHFASSKPKTT